MLHTGSRCKDQSSMQSSVSSIDPFGLLGATVGSTQAEVKQAYFALALLMHPDKGGSAADMIVLHNAYKYVMEQLSFINQTVTIKDLEEQFAAFCMQQENESPTFVDITVDMKAFHHAFDQLPHGDTNGQMLGAALKSGYQASMEQSEYRCMINQEGHMGVLTYSPLDKINMQLMQNEDTSRMCVPFETQIMHYIEPQTANTDSSIYFSEMAHTNGLEDYGTMCMTDYRAAFTTVQDVPPEVSDMLLNRTFEQIFLQRQALP